MAALALLALSPPAAAERPFNVLVLFSESRLTQGMMEVDEGLRAAIGSGGQREVRYYNEFLELGQFEQGDYESRVVAFLKGKYADHPIDLVVTILGSALRFVAQYREELFAEAPIVFCMAEPREWKAIGPVRKATGVLAEFDFRGTLDAALALQPDTRRLVSVIGASPWEQFWDVQIREAFRPYQGRLDFEYLVGLPRAELEERLGRLSGDTIVMYQIVLRDRDGHGYVPEEMAQSVAQAASVPVYALAEPFLGQGTVGGSMVSLREQGRLAGELALRVLGGENPGAIAPIATGTTRPMFDWRQLRRWGLAESRLPAGAEVRYREATLWEQYRWQIVAVLSLVLLQSALISALLVQRRIRRRAEAELRESEQRMSVAAKAAKLGLWVWNIARNDIWVTDDGRALYGETGSGPIDIERFLDTLHPDDRAPTRETIEAALRGTGNYETEYRVALPDGRTRWIAARGQVEFDADRRPVLLRGVSIDVTERKQAELEAARHRTELAHLNRVGMLGQLSASFAHELNQPLTAILSNAQAALRFINRDTVELDELREILKDIVDDDQRAGHVIERLRALFKRGESTHCALDLNDVVREVTRLLRSDLVTRHVVVAADLDPALPQIDGDRVQLQQVVLNLMLNGCEAMADAAPDERRLTLRTRQMNGDRVAVSVSDCGKGIPVALLDRIFEPFVSTKEQGTGLGLSICRSIVLAHHGELYAVNEPVGGATFTAVLPARREDAT